MTLKEFGELTFYTKKGNNFNELNLISFFYTYDEQNRLLKLNPTKIYVDLDLSADQINELTDLKEEVDKLIEINTNLSWSKASLQERW